MAVYVAQVNFVVVHGALFDRWSGYEQTVTATDQNGNFELIGVYPWQGKDTRLYRLMPERKTSPSM